VYEAYALLLFANVTMNVIQQRAMDKLETAQAPLSLAYSDPVLLTALEDTHKQQEDYMSSLHSTTVLGVLYFAFSCVTAAAYSLTTLSLKNIGIHLLDEHTEEYINAAIYGAGFVTSLAALQNLVVIEQAYGHTLLHGYKPIKKFWSAKVLVSLVFIQKIGLACPPFRDWPEAKQHLVYSSLMCFECFLIALFHIVAWQHTEEWYEPLKVARKKKEVKDEKKREEEVERRRSQRSARGAQPEGTQATPWYSSARWLRLLPGRASTQPSSEPLAAQGYTDGNLQLSTP